MTITMACSKCYFIDYIFEWEYDSWQCERCKHSRPDSSKREDVILSKEEAQYINKCLDTIEICVDAIRKTMKINDAVLGTPRINEGGEVSRND